MREDIFVFGAGGHAKVVLDVIEKQGIYQTVCLFDDNASLEGTDFYGYRVVGGREKLLADSRSPALRRCIVAVGDNRDRLELAEWMSRSGFELVTAVHCSSQVARGVTLGRNTVVMGGTVINSDTKIMDSIIINTAATVDHDCLIHCGVHIAPGCHLCGSVTIGEGAFLGAGTIVTPGVTIGEHAVIGAGSVVVKDVPDHAVAKGVPCTIQGG
jgi:sugar O-acyltransferase (sialic acid O-acetyltransferase NeuD family)